MYRVRTHRVAPAVLIAVASAVQAQPAASTGTRDPLNAKAAVPSLVYRSAFSNYRPLSDERVDWKDANDTVGRIGGWREYLKEAQQPDAPARPGTAEAPATAESAKPAPGERRGHDKH